MGLFGDIMGAVSGLGPITSLIGGVIGDVTSASGQEATNAANMQINKDNINAAWQRQQDSQNYNANQSLLARNFSAQQVQQQEQFQRSTQQEAENYDTTMSNTAMQRRVNDLRNAGLNPLLAVSQGGASTPTLSGLTGNVANAAQASGGPAGQGSGIPMQNPNAAFGNLGGIINSSAQVAQTQAQIDLLKAQTNKTNTEAGVEIPAQVKYLEAMTGLNTTQAAQVQANLDLLRDTFTDQWTTIANQRELSDIQVKMQGQNLDVLKATRDALISATNSDAAAKKLGLEQIRNVADVQKGPLGTILAYLNAILQPLHSAAGAYGNVK